VIKGYNGSVRAVKRGQDDGRPDFELLAAIDLRGGRVVRLREGDFDRETVYDDDPVAVAQAFAADGARWLHVVDLDAVRTGSSQQGDALASIVDAVGERVGCEVAGGLRDDASVAAALDGGARRVVVGTAALREPGFVSRLVARHGADRIAVALDVRAGLAVGEGWRRDASGVPVTVALETLAAAGATTFEVTAIARDGGLVGPDLDLLGRLASDRRVGLIASGGIASIDDLLAVRRLGCVGAIVGTALYEGRLGLPTALAALAAEPL
jgi:phosphoribosylformimino-5-aminoimidazole carboxamide ribotide isomerase